MATTAQLKIQIQADMAQAKKDLEAINQVVAEMSPQAQLTAQSLREVDNNLSALSGVVLGAATAFLSLQTAMQAIKLSDDYNQMASRIKMVTASTEEYTMVQERLMEVADRTYKPISTIQELFVRSASSMRELGYSTKETVDFIDSISSSLTINSASTDRANLAIAALNRSMTAGKVAAQEWEMVMNVMPTIAADIATYLRETGKEANATEQSVKNMAKDGQISMELMAASAIYAKDKVAELAENMPTTFGDAMTRLGSHLSAYLADTNNSIGATEKLVEAINFVTLHLDEFAKVVAALVAGALARYGVILVQNTLTTIKAAAAKKILIAQEVALAQAQVAATRAAMTEAAGHTQAMAAARAHQAALVQLAAAQKAASTVMMGMGLPGLAMTVASVAAGLLLFRDNTETTKESIVDLNISLEEAIDKFAKLDSSAKRNAAISDTKKEVSNLKDQFAELAKSIGNYGNLGDAIFDKNSVTDIAEYMKTLQKDLYKASTDALNGQTVNWNKLSDTIQNSTAIGESYRQQLLATVRSLQEKDEQIQKGIDLAGKQAEANKNLSEQDKERAAAQREFISSANSLEGELKKLTGSIDGNINSSRTSADVISLLETQLATLKDTAGATPEKIDQLTKSLDKLKAKQQDLDNINNEKYIANLKKQTETAGLSAADKQRYDINSNKTWTGDQKERALADVAKQEAQENARKAAEKAKSTSDSLAKSNLSWVEGLEKQNATLNLGKAATLEYELAQKQLSGALLERAKASIEAFRAAQQLANAKVNSGMQVELLRLTGQDYQADLLELENKFKETTEQLKKEGNTAGLEIAEQLLNTGKAKAQIDAIKKEIEKAFNKQSVAEQGIQAQITARQISQYEGQKRLTQLHKQTAAVVEQYLPELEKAAQMPGAMGEQSASYLAEVNNQLLVLKTTTNELENAFRTGLQDGLQSSVEGMIKGTMDLRDAVINLADSILTDVGNLAAQKVSEIATDKMMQLFNFSSDQSTPQATAISNASEQGAQAMKLGIEQGSQLAAQNLATAMRSNAGTGTAIPTLNNVTAPDAVAQGALNGGLQDAVQGGGQVASTSIADSMLQAGSQVGSMLSSSLLSGGNFLQQGLMSVFQSLMSMLGGSAGGAGGLASSAASLITGAMGYAGGGHIQGAGTGTSDSIPAWLSNDEFVTQSKVVRQPGMLAFLNDLNRRGWGAVHDLTRVRHSTGGLAGIPAPNVPNPVSSSVQPVTNTGSATTVENAVNLHVYDDPNRIIGAATSDAGMDQYYLKVERNPQRLKSILGI